MARSADPDKQATRAIRALSVVGKPRHGNRDDGKIHGLGTQRQYWQIFRTAAAWFNERANVLLYNITPEQARLYLEDRSTDIGQKQLNNERKALEMYLRYARSDKSLSVDRVKSEVPVIERSRAYTDDQITLITTHQSASLSLSTRLADTAGLRAAELHTLRRFNERTPSTHRAWSKTMHLGREDWSRYTVVGKGGLIREVRLSPSLTRELEAQRLPAPKTLSDRGIRIQVQYGISGGKNFSNLFSRTAQKALGWSEGAHGLRHSYAQRRIDELQSQGQSYPQALGIISQELGHFRPDITEVYLR